MGFAPWAWTLNRCLNLDFGRYLPDTPSVPDRMRHLIRNCEETIMAWKAPKIVEVPVGMEINMYACAARK